VIHGKYNFVELIYFKLKLLVSIVLLKFHLEARIETHPRPLLIEGRLSPLYQEGI